tara:strand:+ start:152 stop:1081 length:930 start_codon:yes stop_codon:yes gene_type:complete
MSKPLSFFKGEIVPISDANVNIMTHALHYGTAVFEGVRGNWNKAQSKMFVFRLKEHYERLLRGCSILLMDIPYDVQALCDITINLINECEYQEDLYIRPIAYKSTEKVADLRLHKLDSDFALIIVPFGSYIETEGAIRCCTSSWRRMNDTNMPPRVKISGNYVNSILAKTEAVMAGFDEGIMLNQDGSVSEGTGENLFLVIDGMIHTPSLENNILTGITRDSVFQLIKNELELEVIERPIDRSEIYLADEMFLTGTAAHVTPVGELDNRKIGSGNVGPVTEKLSSMYAKVIRGEEKAYLDWCTPISVSN